MRIVVLSDCRRPTLSTGGHGLGRLAHSLATTLSARGHEVALWAGPGSVFEGALVIHANETERAKTVTLDNDAVYLDCSHFHELSQHHPDYKIINWVLDGECPWKPPNALVTTAHDLQFHPSARLIPLGIDVDCIPFYDNPLHYLAFAAKIHATKGYADAVKVHLSQSIPVKFAGERFVDDPLPDWRDTLHGQAFYDFVGYAIGLLHPLCNPSALGGGLMPLEAAAMGVPSIVYDWVSPKYHVEHCVSGYVVKDLPEMIDAVQDLPMLDRKKAREWVADTHSIKVMVNALEKEFERVNDGS